MVGPISLKMCCHGNVLTIGTTTKQEEYMNICTFLFLNYNDGISRILECPI